MSSQLKVRDEVQKSHDDRGEMGLELPLPSAGAQSRGRGLWALHKTIHINIGA